MTSLGDGRFRMDFDWGNRHGLRAPGVCDKGNLVLQSRPAPGIDLSANDNVTLRDMRLVPSLAGSACAGVASAFQCIVE